MEMKQAIEKAIYYSSVNQYTNPILTIEYHDLESFSGALKSLLENIDVVTFFAPRGSPAYSIFSYLPSLYEKLFLDKIDSLLLVNRQDFCVKLVRNLDTRQERAGILKIDSVLSEYSTQSSWSYLTYPSLLIVGVIAGVMGIETIKNN